MFNNYIFIYNYFLKYTIFNTEKESCRLLSETKILPTIFNNFDNRGYTV